LGAGLLGLGAYTVSTLLVQNQGEGDKDNMRTDNRQHPWPPQDRLALCDEAKGPDGFTKQWKNAKGYEIFSYFWPTTHAEPKGVLYLMHGHNVNIVFEFLRGRGVGVDRVYEGSWIQALNKIGYSCCGIDVQSMGRSAGFGGLRSYFESFEDVIADDFAFIEKMADLGGDKFSKGLPLFPFAVSMGGARAAMMILRNESVFKAALLYAPMLSLERISKQGLNRFLRPLIAIFNLVGPTWRLAGEAKSKFPNLQEEFDNDFFSDHSGESNFRVLLLHLFYSDASAVWIGHFLAAKVPRGSGWPASTSRSQSTSWPT